MNRYLALPKSRPRLLIPDLAPKAQAQAFMLYAPGSIYGKVFKTVGMIAARIGIFKLLKPLKVAPEYAEVSENIRRIISTSVMGELCFEWEKVLNTRNIAAAFSLGTEDRFQKVTALIFDEKGDMLSIAKIGETSAAKKMILHEYQVLEKIKRLSLQNCVIPTALGCGSFGEITWMMQSVLSEGKPSSAALCEKHFDFLAELASLTRTKNKLDAIPFWKQLNFPQQTSEIYPMVSAHGDFAPWNIRLTDKKIAVYDWENFIALAPAGWDIMRFIFMTERMLKKQPIEKIYSRFIEGEYRHISDRWEKMTGIGIPDRRLLADLFIAELNTEANRSSVCDRILNNENLHCT